jgi:hypothetical protein
MVENSRGS